MFNVNSWVAFPPPFLSASPPIGNTGISVCEPSMMKGSIFCLMVQAFCLHSLSSHHFLFHETCILAIYLWFPECAWSIPGDFVCLLPPLLSSRSVFSKRWSMDLSPCWNFLKGNQKTHIRTHTPGWYISHKARFIQFKELSFTLKFFPPVFSVKIYLSKQNNSYSSWNHFWF